MGILQVYKTSIPILCLSLGITWVDMVSMPELLEGVAGQELPHLLRAASEQIPGNPKTRLYSVASIILTV